MKNRFYYSPSQAAMRPDHFTYVWNGQEWVCYSEWISTSDRKSNWDDAKLVFETDERPEIRVESYEEDECFIPDEEEEWYESGRC